MIPENRRLPREKQEQVVEYVRLGANKKRLQIDLKIKTGKYIPLKDIHNMTAKAKDSTNNFEEAIKLIREHGIYYFLPLIKYCLLCFEF